MNLFSLFSLCFTITFGLFLSGCSSDVSMVKNGTMSGFERTTIGKAFEASFNDPKWETFKGKKGERVVQFTGKISKDMHDTAMKGISGKPRVQFLGVPVPRELKFDWKIGDPVQVQWVIRPDGKEFDLVFMGSPSWEGVPMEDILTIIYG